VRTGGCDIVWRWSFWDHLVQDFDDSKAHFGVVAEEPGRLDVNVGVALLDHLPQSGDWIHTNSVAYSAERDQILLSSNFLSDPFPSLLCHFCTFTLRPCTPSLTLGLKGCVWV